METFTVRDLRECLGDLIRDAEEGGLSVITKHGPRRVRQASDLVDESLLSGRAPINWRGILPRLINELVVTDAGPLVALGRQNLMGLLPTLFKQAHVPDVLIRECLSHPERPDAQRIEAARAEGWLLVRDASPWDMRDLDLGERRATEVALDLGAALLVDDRAARRHARDPGVSVWGTLCVLLLAKRKGLINEVTPVAQAMRQGGHFISQSALQLAREI